MSVRVSDQGRVRPLVTLSGFLGGSVEGGPSGQVPTANGSNQVSWGSNVAIITSNGSNALIGPFVNLANGSNVLFTLDRGPFPQQALPSNTLRIHAQGPLDALVTDLTISSPQTGQVLGYDGAEWDNRQPVPAVSPKSIGRYISQPSTNTSGAAPTLDRLTYMPHNIASGTVDRLGIWVTAGGTAGSVVRLGLYLPDINGLPGTLLVDGGTVDTTGTGFKEVTVSTAVPAGLIYFAVVPQVAVPTWVHTNFIRSEYISEVTPTNATNFSYFEAGVSGSLPSTASSSLSINTGAGNNARFWIRYTA